MSPVAALIAAGCPACGATEAALAATDGRLLPTALLAGFIDGFNPCAFTVAVTLAGVLAAGGRRRAARLAGGVAFCFGSFLTYMLMGLGLLQVLQALGGLETARILFNTLLALSLFALSYLSLRDAVRYRRARVPQVIVLQLPAKVKTWIRSVAETSWKGPSVVLAGVACGVVVTVLDSLCTGQVYVPVLTLLANEPHIWRRLAYLAIYNTAFVLPLVAVFAFAAKGADALVMSRWSKRNVVPAKLALAVVFLALGVMILPTFGGALAEWLNL